MARGRPGERGRQLRIVGDDTLTPEPAPSARAEANEAAWNTGGGEEKRDPREFYVSAGRASDNMGQVRLSLRDKGIGEQIVAQRLVPEYRTFADLVRDAVHHRILELQELGVLDEALCREVRLSDLEYQLQKMAEKQRAMESIMDLARELYAANSRNPTMLMNVAARLIEMADQADEQKMAEALGLAKEMTDAARAAMAGTRGVAPAQQ